VSTNLQLINIIIIYYIVINVTIVMFIVGLYWNCYSPLSFRNIGRSTDHEQECGEKWWLCVTLIVCSVGNSLLTDVIPGTEWCYYGVAGTVHAGKRIASTRMTGIHFFNTLSDFTDCLRRRKLHNHRHVCLQF
jgi:hypothetical protein